MGPAETREMEIARALSKAVDDSGLSQKEVAARCGLPLHRLHSTLHAGVHIRAADVAALCSALGLDANDVLGIGERGEVGAAAPKRARLDDAALDYLAEHGPSTSAPLLMRGLQKMGYGAKLPDVKRALASMGIRAASETRPTHSASQKRLGF